MDIVDIGKAIVGSIVLLAVYSVGWAVLVQLPGHFVYSLFVASERDPDNHAADDASGIISSVVGIGLWVIIGAIGYGIYNATK